MRTMDARILNRPFWKPIGFLCVMTLTISLLFAEATLAATYFLSPTGSDANVGTSGEASWKTFDRALDQLGPGDTLILKDGVYSAGTTGLPDITKTGTASAPVTIKAEHERKARINGDGCVMSLYIHPGSAYLVFDGLVVNSADNSACPSANTGPVLALRSHHLTFKNMVIYRSNRYSNSILMNWSSVSDSLVEDTELYYFHRHAIGLDNSDRNSFRRIYCNHRTGTIPGGRYNGNNANGADMCITIYPGNNNLVENLIGEGDQSIFDIQSLGPADNNRFLGIVQRGGFGPTVKARGGINSADGSVDSYSPRNTLIKDLVVIDSGINTPYGGVGLYARGNENFRCEHCSFLGGNYIGFVTDVESVHPGYGGPYTAHLTDTLAIGQEYGLYIGGLTSWTITNSNAFANSAANYIPVPPSPNHINVKQVDPRLGPCKLWIPDSSPMKSAGTGGADIGATVLYRYQAGTLTNIPLWDPVTGKFPCRAIVAGLNDVPGSSCNDVHQRLNVNTNGCLFPANYTQSRDTTPPTAPQNVSVR